MASAWIGAILLLVLGVIATVFASRFVERRTGRSGRPVASIGRSFGYFGCVAIDVPPEAGQF